MGSLIACRKCQGEKFYLEVDITKRVTSICCDCTHKKIVRKASPKLVTIIPRVNEPKELILYWTELWKKANNNQEPAIDWGKQMKRMKQYIQQFGSTEMKRLIDLYFLQFDDKFIRESNWSLSVFLSDTIINKLRRL